MTKPRVLIQLDPDRHASSFDALVAVDSGVDHLLPYSNVEPRDVRDLVYGAIFTRSPRDLKSTAIFIGGSDVAVGESLLQEVVSTFFGPLRVSVMMDSNGCNTTASAAVMSAAKHVRLEDSTALILAGTGPVGQRIARLLAARGANVFLASRSIERASHTCDSILRDFPAAMLTPVAPASDAELSEALEKAEHVYCAGAAGARLLPENVWRSSKSLRVAIDLNAVPPLGIEGIKVHDSAVVYDNTIFYGAIGVGGIKMKLHRESIHKLFTDNKLVLDLERIYEIGVTTVSR